MSDKDAQEQYDPTSLRWATEWTLFILISIVADGSKPNTCFVSSDAINGFQGKVYIGVREVQQYEHERYRTKYK
jgi:hypothetical protein